MNGCSQPVNDTIDYCVDCNAQIRRYDVDCGEIQHNTTTNLVNFVDSTCTTDGHYQEHTQCKCGAINVTSEVKPIPCPGHSLTIQDFDDDETGFHWHVEHCAICGLHNETLTPLE